MYCRKCGRELSDGASFCLSCGEPATKPSTVAPAAKVPVGESVAKPLTDDTVSVGNWFLTMLLTVIPIAYVVMLFILAFGKSNPSKKNWARATLTWVLAVVLLGGLIFAIAGGALFHGLSPKNQGITNEVSSDQREEGNDTGRDFDLPPSNEGANQPAYDEPEVTPSVEISADRPADVNEQDEPLYAERHTGSYDDYKKVHFNSAEASSEIVRNGWNFSVSHVIDGSTKTCWQENAEGIGANEWVKLDFQENTAVDVLKFRLGYGEDNVNYLNNSRPSELKIEFSDGQSITWDFPDVNEDYALKLSETVYTDWVTLTIIDAYDGKIWPDTSIAEVTAYTYSNPNVKLSAGEGNSPTYADESETWGYATLASSGDKSVEALVSRELTENGRWNEYFDGTSSDVWLKEYPDKSCRVRQTTTMTTGREFELFITNNANAYRSRTGAADSSMTACDMAIEEYSQNKFDHMYSELDWLGGNPVFDESIEIINGNSWYVYSGYNSGSGTQDFFWFFFFIDESRELAVEVSFEYVLFNGATFEDADFFNEWYLNLSESLLIS